MASDPYDDGTKKLAECARIYTALVLKHGRSERWDALVCGYAWKLADVVRQLDERGALPPLDGLDPATPPGHPRSHGIRPR